jgi:hypothetical protein
LNGGAFIDLEWQFFAQGGESAGAFELFDEHSRGFTANLRFVHGHCGEGGVA